MKNYLQHCKYVKTSSRFLLQTQSNNAKIDELRVFIEHLKILKFMFSVICIQESCLSEGGDTSQMQLKKGINVSPNAKF